MCRKIKNGWDGFLAQANNLPGSVDGILCEMLAAQN